MKLIENIKKMKALPLSLIAVLVVILIVLLNIYAGRVSKKDADCDGCDQKRKKRDSSYMSLVSSMNRGKSIVPPGKVLEHYLKTSKYPPNSRPLSKKNVDRLYPNKRYEYLRPLSRDKKVYFLFTADKYRVVGKESITFSLFAVKGKNILSKKLPIEIHSAVIKTGSPRDGTAVMNVNFKNNHGDNRYTFTLTPSESELKSHHGRAFLSLKYSVDGITRKSTLAFQNFPEKTIAAEFTGKFTEEVKDGSLQISAELHVKKEGFYIINANLLTAKEVPVATTRFKKKLSTGYHKIPLLFFGKVIRDKDLEAPFILKNLWGFRLLPGRKPDREMIRPFRKTYKTKDYTLGQFSDKEYDSEFKRRKIEYLKKAMKIDSVGN